LGLETANSDVENDATVEDDKNAADQLTLPIDCAELTTGQAEVVLHQSLAQMSRCFVRGIFFFWNPTRKFVVAKNS
jgi:hypothetical protein